MVDTISSLFVTVEIYSPTHDPGGGGIDYLHHSPENGKRRQRKEWRRIALQIVKLKLSLYETLNA
jgi:hypothetical protein